MRRFTFLSVLFALILVIPAAAQEATPEPGGPPGNTTTSEVYWFAGTSWGGVAIPGAVSSLVTFDEGASMALTTTGLTPGHAVTIWWVIFNHPEHCTHGGPRCTVAREICSLPAGTKPCKGPSWPRRAMLSAQGGRATSTPT